MKVCILAALTLFFAFAGASWGRAHERTAEFNIPPQALDSALIAFSRQADVQISVAAKAIAGMKTLGVVGRYTPTAALARLLDDTGLEFSSIGERTFSVAMPRGAASAHSALLMASQDSSSGSGQATIPASPVGTQTGVAVAAGSPSSESGPDVRTRGSDVQAEIVVTGTHIRGADPVGSPLIVYSREYIDQTGVATVEQFVRLMPQNFSLIDADTTRTPRDPQAGANVAKGTSINLRGLGAGSTLILLDGHRVAPGGGDGSFVDVSLIPLSAVERVEVLTDGASAIYGADAVGGVVNFVLRKNFEGAETSLRLGDTDDGARERSASQLLGAAWSGGSAMIVAEIYDHEGLSADQRDFIPDQGGPFQILPGQERGSAMFSVRQDLGGAVNLFVDGTYSQREFVQDSTEFGTTQHAEGKTKQYGGDAGLTFDFATDWRAELAAAYSKQSEALVSAISGSPPTEFETIASISSGDLRADGPLFSLPGGDTLMSLGIGHRREKFDDPVYGAGTGLEREVNSAYGEVVLPFVTSRNAMPGVAALRMSLAARYDDYDDVGSSTNPKAGLTWSPVPGLDLRGTWSTSFRAPSLARTSNANSTFVLFPLPNGADPNGTTITVLQFAAGNPELTPEEAESLSVGFDLRPERWPGFYASVSYFDVDYTDRVAQPPLVGSPFLLFSQIETLAPFVDQSPDPAQVAEIFAQNAVADPFGISGATVEALYDGRPHNFAASRVSGYDFSLGYDRSTTLGDLGISVGGEKLDRADYQVVFTAPSVRLLDRVYEPADLRMRGILSWSNRNLASSLAINYVDGYQNDLVTPEESVDSWTTLDWQLTYTAGSDAPWGMQGLSMILTVQNVADEDPPFVASASPIGNFGYDPTNASPRGRVISAQLTKRW